MLTKEQYESKRQERYERLIEASRKAQDEGGYLVATAHSMASCIPFGQPILVGHHSEKRDRNYRARIENKFRKGFELYEKSSRLAERAEAVKKNKAIFSDDPSAVEMLEEKIARLEKQQEMMKATNKLIRKNDREGLFDMGFTENQINRLFEPDFCGRVGFPNYKITNNGANIRRLKERLQVVEKKQTAEDKEEEINGVRIEYSPSENRIRIFYPGRVPLETYQTLKRHGFRVLRSMGEGAFSAYHNNNALYFIKIHIKEAQS